MLNTRHLLKIVAIAIGIFGVWLIYWPLMESWYAASFDPLMAKIESFIFGIIIVIVDGYFGIKVLF